MTVPDASMKASLPPGQANAKTLEEGSPKLHAMVSDTTSEGHKWLPAVMPDGKYVVTSENAVATKGKGISQSENTATTATAAGAGLLPAAMVGLAVVAMGH